MAIVNLNTIKNWFKTGLKPSQLQFWDTWDSFWHKEEKIPTSAIEGIDDLIADKADTEALNNHINDNTVHKTDIEVQQIVDDSKDFSVTQVDRLKDLVYSVLSHVFTLDQSLIEKGVDVALTATYNIKNNDDTSTHYFVDGVEQNIATIDGANHVVDLGTVNDTRVVTDILEYEREGVPATSTINRTVEAVFPTYYGRNADGVIPDEATILLGTKKIVKTNSILIVNPDTIGTEYGWFAAEQLQTGKDYTNWFVAQDNYGTIGAGQFIVKKGTVVVNGQTYDVYMYNYSSELNTNITLS